MMERKNRPPPLAEESCAIFQLGCDKARLEQVKYRYTKITTQTCAFPV